MGAGCGHHDLEFNGMDPTYKRILMIVILINFAMFLVEMPLGFVGESQSLKADALDFFGDSATYLISLLVIGASLKRRAQAAMFKGISLVAMGSWVWFSTLYFVFNAQNPVPTIMGVVGFAALCANLLSVVLLMRYRNGDANVRSVWLCSRNDAIGNVMVILAASGVWATATGWPDIVVAGIMATLFLSSAWQILRQAWHELHHHRETTAV